MKEKKHIIITPEEIRKTQISYKEPKKEYQEEINLFPIDSLEKQITTNQKKTDEFAIEFAEWLMDSHVSELTLKEFKKEKGL